MSALIEPVADPAALAGPRSRASRGLSLLDADPAFETAVPAGDRARARRYLTFEVHREAAGDPAASADSRCVATLVLDGFSLGHVRLGPRRSAFVVGPGDLVPAGDPATASTLATATSRTVLRPLSVLVIDDRLFKAMGCWPELGRALHEQLAENTANQRRVAAINAFPRVDERLLGLMWYFADRWGTVRGSDVHVPLPLTHQALGELVASRRPTVTLALGELGERGCLRRCDDGWLIDRAFLESVVRAAEASVHADAGGPAECIFGRAVAGREDPHRV